MGSVVAVLSGKGGTGKTTVCAGISVALAQAGVRVLCIDCDVGLRNLDIPLGMSDSGALSFQDVSEGGYGLNQAARVGQLLELAGKADVRMLVNRVDKTMLSILRLTIDDLMDSAGLPLLGIVPEDPDVALAAASSMTLADFNRRAAAAGAFRRIARRIQGYPEPIKLR